jgi:hypothetical protein
MSLVANVSSRVVSHAGVASVRFDQGIDADARRQFDGQCLVRRFDVDPGQPIAEEVLSLAAVLGLGADLQSRDMNTLTVAVDRHLPQHMARMRHGGSIDVRGRLADVVDHASASRVASARSVLVR